MNSQNSSDKSTNESFTLLLATEDEFTAGYLKESMAPFGYVILSTQDGQKALDMARDERPDLIIADTTLEGLNGHDLCQTLKQYRSMEFVPIILISGMESSKERVRGFQVGADAFLTKPPDDVELRARVRSLLRIRTQNQRMVEDRSRFERELEERTVELEELTQGLVASLEMANTFNDIDTGAHIRRVCGISEALAREIGLPLYMSEKIRRYASLHDIGKVGVPDKILKKRGKLEPDEWEEMKRHTLYGYELLRAANVDPLAQNIALCHHERFDGTGYPRGLKGADIPIEAQIVALADVYDALRTRRCYKNEFTVSKAIELIDAERGKHFNPELVDAFHASFGRIRAVRRRFKDDPAMAQVERIQSLITPVQD